MIKVTREISLLYTSIVEFIIISMLSTGVSGYDIENLLCSRCVMKKPVLIDYYGELLTFAELSKRTKVNRTTLIMRYKNGIRGEDSWKSSASRSVHSVDYHGKTISLSELSDITGVPYITLLKRYNKGFRDEELLNPPKTVKGKHPVILVDYYGKQLTLSELSRITGIPYATLNLRYNKGDIGEELWKPVEIEVDYYGKSVTLRELAKITEIKYNTIFARYDNGDRGERLWRPVRSRK